MLGNGGHGRLRLLVLIVVRNGAIKHVLVHMCHVSVLQSVLVLLSTFLRLLLVVLVGCLTLSLAVVRVLVAGIHSWPNLH